MCENPNKNGGSGSTLSPVVSYPQPSKPGVAGSSPAGRASPLRGAGCVRQFSGSAATRFAHRERFRVLPGAPLLDGRVLATGGYDNAGIALAQAEIFSAVTGTWSLAASNVVARADHAATRLRDARILVVGGAPSLSSCSPNATAEIYDPTTNRWSLTGDLPIDGGTGMIAVLLRDGRVLAAGGNRCGRISSTAAVFSPSTNTWSTTAGRDVPRAFHSAVLLADARVLADGGNARIQVFDNNLRFIAMYDAVGSPWAVCITRGTHQYLYASSNDDRTDATRGRSTDQPYKLELDGTIVGRFGRSDTALAGSQRSTRSIATAITR